MNPQDVASAVRDSLTPDLVKDEYIGDHPMSGHCYVASEAAYHLLGGKNQGWVPKNTKVNGVQHWWLEHPEHGVVDLTHDQFEGSVPYNAGIGRGFLTAQPSARAAIVINRAIDRLDPDNVGQRTASWDDVQNKAKRLILSGGVNLHRNGWNNIVGTVQGDHGSYQCEIGREDPKSRVITQWTCECPWSDFAWDRTGEWKQYEGRVCSHVLASFWKALATPLDEAAPEDATGLKQGPQGFGLTPAPPTTTPLQTFTPDMSEQMADPNVDPDQVPKQPGDLDQSLQDIQEDDPENFEFMSPSEQKLRQQFPSLFSHRISAGDDFDRIAQMLYPGVPGKKAAEPTVQIVNQLGVDGELRQGKIPVPGATPVGVAPEGHDLYHWTNLGWDPKIKNPDGSMGMQANPPSSGPEERGRRGRIPMGARATAIDVDPKTKQVCILYYTDAYKLQHRLIKTWVDSRDVRIVSAAAPYRQRRR